MGQLFAQILREDVLTMIGGSALIFVLLWGVLGHIIFRYFFSLIAERDRQTVGSVEAAQSLQIKAKSIEDDYQSKILQANVDGLARKDAIVQKAKKEFDSTIQQTLSECQKQLKIEREQTTKKLESAVSFTDQEAEALAKRIAQRLIENPLM